MAIRLLFTAMDSHIYRKHPRLKIMLMSLCNFADEFGKGRMWNGTMSRHIGTGEEQVRRYKRQLEKDGVVKFNYKRGKGRHTDFQIDLVALDMLINNTAPDDELSLNLTPPTGGVTNEVTPPLNQVTPPTEGKNPTPRGGVKRERTIRKTCARGTHDLSDTTLTRYWRKALTEAQGNDWLKSWLIAEQIIETNGQVELLVKSAFGKARVESVLETLSGGDTVMVTVHEQGVRAV